MSTALDLGVSRPTAESPDDRLEHDASSELVSELGNFVEREVSKRAGRPVTLALALPAENAAPRLLLDLEPSEDAFLWLDDSGECWSGLGVAHRLDTRGTDALGAGRFARLRELASQLASRVEVAVHPALLDTPHEGGEGDADQAGLPAGGGLSRNEATASRLGPGLGPRLFGGAAFCSEGAGGPEPSAGLEPGVWSSFGDCSFVLPRWAVSRRRGQSVLWLTVRCDDSDETGAASGARIEEVLAALRTGSGGSGSELAPEEWPRLARSRTEPSSAAVSWPESRAPERWIQQIEDIRSAIGSGALKKVVAARCAELDIGQEIAPETLFAALEGSRTGCTRFLFRRGSGSFLGATPERLVCRRGRRVVTHALAGSIERSGRNGGSARELLASKKDQIEHRLVVDHLVERLSPVCEFLEWSDTSVIRRLRDVLHLETPMEGLLNEDLDVLDLVARLHPTPAVGGVPVEDAVRWIIDREDQSRGWYSGPVGWFDLDGDGDFVVALRSVLLDESAALAYVGAGIVADSDPVAEWKETEIKLRALRSSIQTLGTSIEAVRSTIGVSSSSVQEVTAAAAPAPSEARGPVAVRSR